MEYYHIILFLLALAIGISAIAPKLKIPYPVLLMLAGIAIGFIPGVKYIPIQPEVVFLMFLPPMLYDAALNMSFPQFRENLGTISMLAVTMVFITMVAIAIVCHYFVPGISWPLAFVIGAILSPPDAVAASGIIKNMNLSSQTKAILEGESLVNDASALTAYRIAMGVVSGGAFVFWKAGLEFIVIILGGAGIGFVMAGIFTLILHKVKLDSTATVSLSILFPFVAYQFAESVGVSGVLAVVAMGLLISRRIHRENLFSHLAIVQSKSVWSVIIYLLSGLIFILIGLEFPQVIKEIPSSSIVPLLFSSFLIFLIALVVRISVIFEHQFRVDKINKGLNKKRLTFFRFHNKEVRKQVMSLDWKNSLIIGWSGMRGIVSVATAIALPMTLADGESFPQRNSIIFITVIVVILMLLIQGIGLPFMIRLLKINNDSDKVEI